MVSILGRDFWKFIRSVFIFDFGVARKDLYLVGYGFYFFCVDYAVFVAIIADFFLCVINESITLSFVL